MDVGNKNMNQLTKRFGIYYVVAKRKYLGYKNDILIQIWYGNNENDIWKALFEVE
jgi:hypothetical protein